jgi:hypothetical protein
MACHTAVQMIVPLQKEKDESSFLKKRSKNLLLVAAGSVSHPETRMLTATDQSFLVLFFKK